MFGMKRRDSSCCMLLGGRNSARPLAARLRIVVGEIREHANAAHPLGLRAYGERPSGRRAAERGQEFSSFDMACHVTLRLGVIHAMRDDTTLQ